MVLSSRVLTVIRRSLQHGLSNSSGGIISNWSGGIISNWSKQECSMAGVLGDSIRRCNIRRFSSETSKKNSCSETSNKNSCSETSNKNNSNKNSSSDDGKVRASSTSAPSSSSTRGTPSSSSTRGTPSSSSTLGTPSSSSNRGWLTRLLHGSGEFSVEKLKRSDVSTHIHSNFGYPISSDLRNLNYFGNSRQNTSLNNENTQKNIDENIQKNLGENIQKNIDESVEAPFYDFQQRMKDLEKYYGMGSNNNSRTAVFLTVLGIVITVITSLIFLLYRKRTEIQKQVVEETSQVVEATIADRKVQASVSELSKSLIQTILSDEEIHKMSGRWVLELLTNIQEDIGKLVIKILRQQQVLDELTRLGIQWIGALVEKQEIKDQLAQLVIHVLLREDIKAQVTHLITYVINTKPVYDATANQLYSIITTEEAYERVALLGRQASLRILEDELLRTSLIDTLTEVLRKEQVKKAGNDAFWSIISPWYKPPKQEGIVNGGTIKNVLESTQVHWESLSDTEKQQILLECAKLIKKVEDDESNNSNESSTKNRIDEESQKNTSFQEVKYNNSEKVRNTNNAENNVQENTIPKKETTTSTTVTEIPIEIPTPDKGREEPYVYDGTRYSNGKVEEAKDFTHGNHIQKDHHDRNHHDKNSHDKNNHDKNSHDKNNHDRNYHDKNNHDKNNHDSGDNQNKKENKSEIHKREEPSQGVSQVSNRSITSTSSQKHGEEEFPIKKSVVSMELRRVSSLEIFQQVDDSSLKTLDEVKTDTLKTSDYSKNTSIKEKDKETYDQDHENKGTYDITYDQEKDISKDISTGIGEGLSADAIARIRDWKSKELKSKFYVDGLPSSRGIIIGDERADKVIFMKDERTSSGSSDSTSNGDSNNTNIVETKINSVGYDASDGLNNASDDLTGIVMEDSTVGLLEDAEVDSGVDFSKFVETTPSLSTPSFRDKMWSSIGKTAPPIPQEVEENQMSSTSESNEMSSPNDLQQESTNSEASTSKGPLAMFERLTSGRRKRMVVTPEDLEWHGL